MLDLAAARQATIDLCEPTLDPTLDTSVGGEIDKALARTAIAAIWTASTAYSVGQKVVPPIPRGRVFIATLAGTSDASEPQWLIAPRYDGPVNPYAGSWWGGGVLPVIDSINMVPWVYGLADGTAAWRDYGPFAGEIYDANGAAAECWRLRARKVANQPKRKRLGPLLEDYLTYEQCIKMANSLQPVRIV